MNVRNHICRSLTVLVVEFISFYNFETNMFLQMFLLFYIAIKISVLVPVPLHVLVPIPVPMSFFIPLPFPTSILRHYGYVLLLLSISLFHPHSVPRSTSLLVCGHIIVTATANKQKNKTDIHAYTIYLFVSSLYLISV